MKEYSLVLSVLVFLFAELLVQLLFTSKTISIQESVPSLLLHLITSVVVLIISNQRSITRQDFRYKYKASWLTQMFSSILCTQKKVKLSRKKGWRKSKKYKKVRKPDKKQVQYGITKCFSTIWCYFNKGDQSVPGSSNGNSSHATNNSSSPVQDVNSGQSPQDNSTSTSARSTDNHAEQNSASQGQSSQSNSSSSMHPGSTDNDAERSSDSQMSSFEETSHDSEKPRSSNPPHASVGNSKRRSESEIPGTSSMAMPENPPQRKKLKRPNRPTNLQLDRVREMSNRLDRTPPSPLPSPSADVQVTSGVVPPVHSRDDTNEVASYRSAEQVPMPARRVKNGPDPNIPFPRQVQSDIVVPNGAFDDRRRTQNVCAHPNCQADLIGSRPEICVSCISAFCRRHAANHLNCRACVICHTPAESGDFCVSCGRLICPYCISFPHACRVWSCPVTGRSHVLQSVGEPPRCPICILPLCPGCAQCHRCAVGPPRTF